MNIPQSQPMVHPAINKIYDVVIVGAGPIGLATAVGLRKRGIDNILIVDQTRTFHQVGQAVDLLPNGLKALKYVDPQAYQAVKSASLSFINSHTKVIEPKASQEWVSKNFQGQRVRSISLSFDVWFHDYGEGRVSISWYDLQTTLRQMIPEDQVKPNHRCINVVDEPENGCVRIDCLSSTNVEANPYAYWSDHNPQSPNVDGLPQPSVTKSFRSKLIVAADGINSTVRRILYADGSKQAFAKPEYSGFVGIYCRDIPNIPQELRSHIEEEFLAGSPIITVANYDLSERAFGESPRMLLINRQGIGYIVHLLVPLHSIQDKSGLDLLNLVLPELEQAGWPLILTELVRLSPPENIGQRPYYIHRAAIPDKILPSWSAGRVVLVGDAAHGMPPFMAQGANQGFEDAMVVTKLITDIAQENNWDNKQAIASAFEKYERIRRPLMAYIQQATLTQFPNSSNQAWQEYSQKVYTRNFDQFDTAD